MSQRQHSGVRRERLGFTAGLRVWRGAVNRLCEQLIVGVGSHQAPDFGTQDLDANHLLVFFQGRTDTVKHMAQVPAIQSTRGVGTPFKTGKFLGFNGAEHCSVAAR